MKKYLEILKECPLFYSIEEASLLRMLECLGAKVICFDKKYTILAEGTPARYIGILLSGRAQVLRMDFYGNRTILSEILPTEIFAEAFACAEAEAISVTIVAEEPCEVMLINCSHILHTCQNNCGFHQQLIFNLMKDLAQKNLALHRKAEITSKRSTREKLLFYLMLQAQKSEGEYFEIPFDRQELADYLQVDRSGLSAEISKLRKEGILDNHRNTFRLL